MGDWFLGEIRVFPYGFAPSGWMNCDGTILNIMQNQALFSLLGNAFGGNGTSTFALPDLRGRVAVHPNPQAADTARMQIARAEQKGQENCTLAAAELPLHTHVPLASNAVGQTSSISTTTGSVTVGNYWAAGGTGTGQQNLYAAVSSSTPLVAMNPSSVKNAGGGQGHANMQPFQPVRYCIAVQGIYPSHQ